MLHTTSCIKHWGLSGYLKHSALHQHCVVRQGRSPQSPTLYTCNRWASYKKTPDYKES